MHRALRAGSARSEPVVPVLQHRRVNMTEDRTVVGRAMAIVDAVTMTDGPVSLAELTRRTGLPKPTVRRIANELVQQTVLERTPDGYRAGTRLIYQGLRAAHQHGVSLTVQPYLQDLHFRTRGEPAWYATVLDGQLIAAGAAFGRSHLPMMRTSWWKGYSVLGNSIVLLASGRLQIAHDDEQAEHVLSRGWAPLTRYSVTDRQRMQALLAEARETGFVREDEQSALGWCCVAAAVRDSGGRLLGAIGVTGRPAGIETRSLRSELLKCADSLRQDLAATAEGGAGESLWHEPSFSERTGVGYAFPIPRHPTPPAQATEKSHQRVTE